ncbi:SusD/RagB family nutrient-binding outer membrane lipoprotein [Sphingobacterium wenxiniae]|uniref:Starch-binding associating with outer membrane n=1 Tax=Sphingobacterium wenxiniae TaxID=683125 RepID=A0A1I6V562_9SPHI|nr:SusD/RagB family nutrient-binding outer membrane lipoprotein [Sphingobacterium wenxiniae]SFT08767.1 Starch-binding associating with outer membrane [Sphingobacterium wenxiniae]
MKNIFYKYFAVVFAILTFVGCNDKLTELNQNPNGVDPDNANVNLLLPGILTKMSGAYAELDNGISSGVVQHMQEDGWYNSYNHYVWSNRDWGNWYNVLRDNELMIKSAVTGNFPMHEGIGYVIRAFSFGTITDLWGDAPYTEALKAGEDVIQPAFDSQEVIYRGVLADLDKAVSLFKNNTNTGIIANSDLVYQGNIEKWHQFANTLILRYAMRLSAKLPDVASEYIKKVYDGGVYIDKSVNDAGVRFLGNTSVDSWYMAQQFDSDGGSGFRRRKPAKPLVDNLLASNDPRLQVWVAPVHCQWVEDLTLTVPTEPFVRKDDVPQTYVSLTDEQYVAEIEKGHKFTRHYNPNLLGHSLDTDLYVGIPVGSMAPDGYNNNPTPGQSVQNQHVSQLAPKYRATTGDFLRRRLSSATETLFILAEAAQRGWITASAETYYNEAVRQSLQSWGVAESYSAFIGQSSIKYDGTLNRIIEQKWIASWNCSTEAWMDFRRTGLPQLVAGPASAEPVLPVRLIYGNNELSANQMNANVAIEKLEETAHSNIRGKNSQWSKPWLLQGTNKPW